MAKPAPTEVKAVDYHPHLAEKFTETIEAFEKLFKTSADEIFKGSKKEEAKAPPVVVPKIDDHLFTKENVKHIFLAAFKRKPEELKDDEFDYFFSKIE